MNLKNAISYIFSFFLAFFMFIIVLLGIGRFTIFSESYFLSTLDDTNYYRSAVAEYNNQLLMQNARPTQFPVELFEDYVVVKDVEKEMKSYIQGEFRRAPLTVNSEVLRTRLVETTNAYIQEKGIAMDATTQAAIATFIDANTMNYQKVLQFPYVDYYGNFAQLYHNVFLILGPGLLVVCGLLILFQCRMHKSKRGKKRWLTYSFIGTGLFASVCPITLLAIKAFDKIQIAPEYLYKVITTMLNEFSLIMAMVGIGFMIFGCVLPYLKPIKSKKNTKDIRNYEHSVMKGTFRN